MPKKASKAKTKPKAKPKVRVKAKPKQQGDELSPALVQFVDRLVEERGFKGLDEAVIEQIKKDVMTRVEDRINATILQKLPSNKLDDFETLLDSKAGEKKIQDFCVKNIPDLNQEIAGALLRFRDVYLNI